MTARLYIRSANVEANLRDGGDRPAIQGTEDHRQGGNVYGHEAAIVCACCGEVAAVIVNPPGAPLGSVRVWIETEGPVVMFTRQRPNDRGSYYESGVLNPPPGVDPWPKVPPPSGIR